MALTEEQKIEAEKFAPGALEIYKAAEVSAKAAYDNAMLTVKGTEEDILLKIASAKESEVVPVKETKAEESHQLQE